MIAKLVKVIQNEASKVIVFSTPIIVALFLIFYSISIYTTNVKYEKIQLSMEEPIQLCIETGKLQTQIMETECRIPKWVTGDADTEMTISDIQSDFLQLNNSLDKIQQLSPENNDNITALRHAMGQSEQKLIVMIEKYKDGKDKKYHISNSEISDLTAQFFEVVTETEKIQTDSSNQITQWEDVIGQQTHNSLVWAMIISALVVLSIGILVFLNRLSKDRLLEKSKWLNMISENVGEMFIIEDAGRESSEFVSKSSERVLGISRSELEKHKTAYYQYICENDRARIEQAKNTETTEQSIEIKVAYFHPVTREKQCLLIGYYLVQSEMKRKKRITMICDVSKEEERRRNLREALVAARNANESKQNFFSHMSHEIRTPLHSIIGLATIASEYKEDSRRVEDALNKINNSSKHLLMLINDILDMSKIESNKVALNLRPFDLIDFLNRFVSWSSEQCSEKGIHFEEKRIGFGKNKFYIGDATRLNQIALNVMSNAVKFTDAGGQITFEVTRLEEENGTEKIRFSVTDTGIGMEQDVVKRVFQPFEQADSSIAVKYGGTGLGLSITENLVKIMDGYIYINSALGEGTCCVVEIPFETVKQSNDRVGHKQTAQGYAQADPMEDYAQSPAVSLKLKGMRVLIAEDNELNLEIVQELLQLNGIFTEGAKDGAEALDKFQKSEIGYYQAILMDIQMPIMDGYETTRAIRASGHAAARKIPIIAITANAFSEDISAALASGMDAHISKPLHVSKLLTTLEKFILTKDEVRIS
jgi:two-component system sensor histidine kinase/response regulator